MTAPDEKEWGEGSGEERAEPASGLTGYHSASGPATQSPL